MYFTFREDDEDDLSDDDARQRVNMNFREKMRMERDEIRSDFLAYEQGIIFESIKKYWFYQV